MRVLVLNGSTSTSSAAATRSSTAASACRSSRRRSTSWARELGLSARCRADESRGPTTSTWLHEALDWADGVVINPGAWTHYSYAIRDAVELFNVPVVEVHLSNIEAREDWRRHSVIADLAAKRVMGKGPDGYREALEFLGAGRNERDQRMTATPAPQRRPARAPRGVLEEPLLVTSRSTSATSAGFQSSNAALLVEPGGHVAPLHRLPLRRGPRAVEGVELVADERALAQGPRGAARRGHGRLRVRARHLRRLAGARRGRARSSCRAAASSRGCAR